jgi:hypothetical protein
MACNEGEIESLAGFRAVLLGEQDVSTLQQKLAEDRAIRDAAKRNLMADIEHVRESLSGQGIASRVLGRVGDGAVDVLELAKEQAEDKRGVLAALIGALLVWIAREPLFEILGLSDGDEPSDDSQTETDDAPAARSRENHPSGDDYD